MEIDFQHQASRDSHRIAFMMFWKGLISVNQQRQMSYLYIFVSPSLSALIQGLDMFIV